MMRPISARERRLVAVLILVAVVAVFYLGIVSPIVAGFASRAERRQQLELRYAHNLGIVASVPRLRRQAERQRAAIGSFVIAANKMEAGREQLKDRLQRAIERAGGEFRESGDAEGRPGWSRARAAARLTLAQLTTLLAQLQNDPPYLVVETLTVGADEALATGQPSILDVQIEASIPIRPALVR